VAENGALIYCPATREEQSLGDAPPDVFVNALRERDIAPLSVGRVIVATWHPNAESVLETIRDLGLELQLTFNKGAVMVLPSGINKAAGLSAALTQLGLSPHNVVATGDAENDHAFMELCECAVAVKNALPMAQERADYVTAADHGAGVVELIDMIVATDLVELAPQLRRYGLLLGTRADDQGPPMRRRRSNVGAKSSGGSGSPLALIAATISASSAESRPARPVASASISPAMFTGGGSSSRPLKNA
jgi:haloacid dehalogenase-like hydrolase